MSSTAERGALGALQLYWKMQPPPRMVFSRDYMQLLARALQSALLDPCIVGGRLEYFCWLRNPLSQLLAKKLTRFVECGLSALSTGCCLQQFVRGDMDAN